MSSYDEISLCSINDFENVADDHCQTFTPADIQKKIDDAVTGLQAILHFTPSQCLTLLLKHKWDEEKIVEGCYSEHYPSHYLIENRIIPPFRSRHDPECSICCLETELIRLDCDDGACKTCWRIYVGQEIRTGKSIIECMKDGSCKLALSNEQVEQFVEDPDLMAAYRKSIIRSYVEHNLMVFCPSCEKLVKRSNPSSPCATCSCSIKFCFFCRLDHHVPITCYQMKSWQKKVDTAKGIETGSSDKDTFEWILTNTKDCPKCLTTIEKNGGCNKMTCKNEGCRYQFCWKCMKSWNVHGYTACNSYDEAAERSRLNFRADKLRLQFYYNRYKEHEHSLQLEKNLRATVTQKQADLQQFGWISFNNSDFLQKALKVLSESRETLMYTYVFAYYLEKTNYAIMFENNQKDLELATEQLSGYLEQDHKDNGFERLRREVLDKTSYVEQRRKLLVEHCKEIDAFEYGFTEVVEAKKEEEEWTRCRIILVVLVIVFVLLVFLIIDIVMVCYLQGSY